MLLLKASQNPSFTVRRTSVDLWHELEERYGLSSGPLMYQIQRDMSSIQQGTDTLTNYYNRLHRSWVELGRIAPIPKCHCDCYTCGINRKMTVFDSSLKLIQFLMDLNSSLDAIRTQILNMDPLPSANKAFSMVLQVEKQREVTLTYNVGNSVDSSAMMVKSTKSQGGSRGFKTKVERKQEKMEKVCDFCHVN